MSGELWNPTREEYDADPSLRSSALKDFRTSPKLYDWRYVSGKMGPKKQTDAMIFGTAFHALSLEGRVDWSVAGRCEGVIGSGDRKGEQCVNNGKGMHDGKWLCGTHSKNKTLETPPNLITKKDEDDLYGMKEEFSKHEASQWFGDCYKENAIKWTDRSTGIECKALLDGLSFSGAILDLKTTDEFQPDSIWRKLHNNGWSFSSAFYERGRNNLPGITPSACEWIYIIVERSKPYRIQALNLSVSGHDYAAHCRTEVDDMLKELAECRRTGEYPDRDLNMAMPAWVGFITENKGTGR